jgi:ABC-2 type transport system ATP-binding protein
LSTNGPGTFALATHDRRKSCGSRTALAGLELAVPTGVVYGFLGPNGAGKTTTMRLLTGLIHPDAGSIEVLGRPFGRGDRHRLFEVGALVESPSFYPFLSGRENLRELAAGGAHVAAGRIESLLEMTGLRDRANDQVAGYSLGMKQRLGIAGALLSDPKLLLLDEPANDLDPAGIVGMRDTLRALAASGKTVFVSSHLLGEIQQMADVVGIIAAGRLVRQGPIADLLNAEGTVRVRVPTADAERAGQVLRELAGPEHVQAAQTGWISLRMNSDRIGEINRALGQAGIWATGLESGNDLEMLFLELTGGGPSPIRPLEPPAPTSTCSLKSGAGDEAVRVRDPQAGPPVGDVGHVRHARWAPGPDHDRGWRDGQPDGWLGDAARGGTHARDLPRRLRFDPVVHPRPRWAIGGHVRRRDRRLGVDLGHAEQRGRSW